MPRKHCLTIRAGGLCGRGYLTGNPGVSTGTMSMPRVLSLSEDKLSLNVNPPEEVELLRYNEMNERPFEVPAHQVVNLNNISGNKLELDITIDPKKAKKFGLKVFCSNDGREQTPIIIDREKDLLQIDMGAFQFGQP